MGSSGKGKLEVEEQSGAAVCRTAHSLSSSIVRKRSDPELVSRIRFRVIRQLLANLQQVILGTKLCVLFPAIPLAMLAHLYCFKRPWIFALSLLGLAPLAERVCFLTEQIANYTGPTVGGLLNATCGNATELIISMLALHQRKIHVLKYSLLGSILSNLLLVLGTSLFSGGLANIKDHQRFDRKQSDVSTSMMLLGLLCVALPLMVRYSVGESESAVSSAAALWLSRANSSFMLGAYAAYLFFQLKTHRQLFDSPEDEEDNGLEEEAEIGLWSALVWLIGMTLTIALLSEYVVGTIEEAADTISWISLWVLHWGLLLKF
ncbi:unnamed protein product [Cuscuta campestris]|uniref:Sodium/calcium exchanger membrane region domain-containing protein n=1 Tax=Cuscuta campestris TaxID=132261 RepID=A0A484MR59_9ASTE|nr:unnamed protein product [Cuscuta campestris]